MPPTNTNRPRRRQMVTGADISIPARSRGRVHSAGVTRRVRTSGAGPLDKLMRSAGYEPHVNFNAMNARERALYLDQEHGRQVDVFIESFRMCHEIALGDRLALEPRTLPLAELLLTKLQII